MSAWARQRQTIVITYIVLIIAVIVAIVYFLVIYKPPSCFDGERNGLEEGVDCGGGCQLVCPFAAARPNIAWARAFRVAEGVYNIAAEVENPNFQVGTTINYSLKSYDDENVLINEIYESVTLYPKEKRIIFEPAVQTQNRSISRVFLEFDQDNNWYNLTDIPKRIITQGYNFDNLDTNPSLQVELRNTSIRPVGDLIVIAVLYDEEENVEQVSRTLVDVIGADSVGQAFFSWRRPFNNPIGTAEVFVVEPRE